MTASVALDVDSTLAAVTDIAFELLAGCEHGYSYDDIESWTWGFDEFGKSEYLHAIWHSWTIRPQDVPPMEAGLAETTRRLNEQYNVDIVTAQADDDAITDGKIEWLEMQGIEYDNFVPVTVGQSKAKLDYTYYFDDNPLLPRQPNEGKVFLRDQPYNRDANGTYTRVGSVKEAASMILEN